VRYTIVHLTQQQYPPASASRIRLRPAPALLLLLFVLVPPSLAQIHPAPPAASAAPQATALQRSIDKARTGVDVHIFYVHGIGINPPKGKLQDFETSWEFRHGLCKIAKCTSVLLGRDYADKDLFALHRGNDLTYLNDAIWKTPEDWDAAAPFVDHYDLVFRDRTRIHLHEINWWPLIMAAKCRDLVSWDGALVDKDKTHVEICRNACKNDHDTNHDGRYLGYDWLASTPIQDRLPGWPTPALINRKAKQGLLDWSFTDALLAVGPLHRFLIEGIRELLLETLERYNGQSAQDFVIVSHSIGSYLMFSALDYQEPAKTPGTAPVPPTLTDSTWREKYKDFLANTSQAYFMANQLSLLELADLRDPASGLQPHLSSWAALRQGEKATVVAFSDPDDLLTWQIPKDKFAADSSLVIRNVPEVNACRWCFLWLLANPETAHVDYDKNKSVLKQILGVKPIPPSP